MATWGLTISDVLNTTGETVAAKDLLQADAIVTIYVNRTPAASGGISERDLEWVNQAIAWQAAWIAQNVAVAGRSQYDSMSQDGMSVASSAEWAKILGPIAARALKNISWKGTRTYRVPSPDFPRGGFVFDFELEQSDRYSDWMPL